MSVVPRNLVNIDENKSYQLRGSSYMIYWCLFLKMAFEAKKHGKKSFILNSSKSQDKPNTINNKHGKGIMEMVS